jgi:hypothetical protein
MKGGRYLEERHVKNVYDTIAPSFNEIPQKVWPNVKKFIKNLSPGSLVADIGKYHLFLHFIIFSATYELNSF